MVQRNKSDADKFLLSKTSGIQSKFISVLKFVIFVLILPVALGNTYGFLNTLSNLGKAQINAFWLGAFIFFLIDLAVYKLAFVYKKGQRIVAVIFHFFSPLVRFAPYVLPIYTILILFLSIIIGFLGDISIYQKILLFLTGFSIVLHFVYTLDALRIRQVDFLRASHFFAILLIYLFNVAILAITLDRILPGLLFFSEYFRNSYFSCRDIYAGIMNQLF